MNRPPFILATALAALLLATPALRAEGPLNPPGAPAPTMKTLQELWDKIGELEAALDSQNAELTSLRKQIPAQMLSIQSLMGPLFDNLGIALIHWQVTKHGLITADHTSLAFNPLTGFPAIAYFDSAEHDLEYVEFDGVAWQNTTVDGGGAGGTWVGEWCSLAFNPLTGLPAISYYNYTEKDLYYAEFVGGAWQTSVADGSGAPGGRQVGQKTSLAFNPVTGNPSISYWTNDSEVIYGQFDGADWVLTVVDPSVSMYGSTSLAFNPSTGAPSIAYANTSSELKYAKFEALAWQVSTVASSAPGNLRWPSLAFSPSGNPAISYNDSTTLKLAENTGFFWSIATVDASLSDSHSSLAFSSVGQPVIAYRASGPTGSILRLATFAGGVWNPEVVADPGGSYLSLAFTPTGLPAISYSSGILHYAVKAPYSSP